MSPSDSPDHPGSILYRSESSEVPYSRTATAVLALFYKPVTGQELFFAVSYSKPALVSLSGLNQNFLLFGRESIFKQNFLL